MSLAYALKHSARKLFRHPRVLVSISAPLALALAGVTVMSALVWGVLVRPLPFDNPDRLVEIHGRNLLRNNDQSPVTVSDFYDMRELRSFEGVAGFWVDQYTLTGQGEPSRATVLAGTFNYFEVLGIRPIAGRIFTQADEPAGNADFLVLSEGLATRLFGAPGAAIGKVIAIDGSPGEVIGVVAREAILGPEEIEAWGPMIHSAEARANRTSHNLHVIARLRAGVDTTAAKAELDAMMARVRGEYPDEKAGEDAFLVPLQEDLVGGIRGPLVVLLCACALLLLIAIFNVAGLSVARIRERRLELSIRMSLGGSRASIALGIVCEGVFGGLAGGVAAIPLAAFALRLVVRSTAEWVPRVEQLSFGMAEAGFCLAAGLFGGLMVGLTTAGFAFQRGDETSLRASGRVTGADARDPVRASAMILQVAMSFVLLAGAAVLVRSMHEILSTSPGFRTEIVTLDLSLPRATYGSTDAQNVVLQRMVDRVRALPGVETAAVISNRPLAGPDATMGIEFEGQPPMRHGEVPDYAFRSITPGYFETMGIPILRGRDFNDRDVADAPLALIVNEAFVRRVAGGRDVIGLRATFAGPQGPWYEIVGVVGDTREAGPDSEPVPLMLTAFTQRTWNWMNSMSLMVRTTGDPAASIGAIRGAVRMIDPRLPVKEVLTVDEHIRAALGKRRFQLALLVAFAIVAVLLTIAGLYGLVVNALVARTREVGVRIALGASPRNVVALFVRQGLALAGAGLILGATSALILGRFLESMVVRVSPSDPLSILLAAAGLFIAAALACLVPARRALSIEPARVLRTE